MPAIFVLIKAIFLLSLIKTETVVPFPHLYARDLQ